MGTTVFLGGGRITSALTAGLRLAKDRRRIVVYDRHPEKVRALRRETVEANQNSEGSEALTDLRRKSERGQAAVTFTGRGARTFDQAPVSGPPVVPEARRAAIQSYFVRRQ